LLGAQGHRQAFADITLPNPASVGLHQAMGFRRVATFHRVGWKLGAWHDVGWWQREVGDAGDNEPFEPMAFRQLSSATIRDLLRNQP